MRRRGGPENCRAAPVYWSADMSSIRTLKTFLAVVKHGSFAGAGKEIGLTSAAVGLQIHALEEDLNQVLFGRGGRAVVLNTSGRRMVPQIEELVRRYESMAKADDDEQLSGTVVMGALISALMGAFADALWSLKQQHPRLEVQLFAGLSSVFAHKVELGEFDAAVVTQSPRPLPASLMWTPLYNEPMVMIVPRRPHFPLDKDPLKILRNAPFIRFDRTTWTGRLINDVLKQCRVTVKDEMELNSVEAIVEIVRQGFGISIVPQLANVNWARDRSLVVMHLPGVDVQRRVGLLERIRHNRMHFTQALKAYFDVRQATQKQATQARAAQGAPPAPQRKRRQH
jgi:DNA-binding transcriptional LysR family regulator